MQICTTETRNPPGGFFRLREGLCNFLNPLRRVEAAQGDPPYAISMIGGVFRMSCLPGIGGFKARHGPHCSFDASV